MGKVYDPAYKLEICQQVESGLVTGPEFSRETEVNENTMYSWLNQYRKNKIKLFVGGRANYQLHLPNKKLLEDKLREFTEIAEVQNEDDDVES